MATTGEFKIGDRVNTNRGKGTIIGFTNGNISICVEHDKKFSMGHNGNGFKNEDGTVILGKQGHCWFYGESDLRHIKDELNEHGDYW